MSTSRETPCIVNITQITTYSAVRCSVPLAGINDFYAKYIYLLF